MNHLAPFALDGYLARPSGLGPDVTDRIEDHVLHCDRCRARIAGRTSGADLDRSWAMIERQLPNQLPSRTSSNRDDRLDLVASNAHSAGRETRRPLTRMLLAAAALVGVVGGLAWVFRVGPEPLPSSAVPASWEAPGPADGAIFASSGDLLGIAGLLEWHGELLVVGAVRTSGGQRHVAWTSAGGGRWAQREIEFPHGCDPWSDIAVRGEELVVGCVRGDPTPAVVSVATTADLQTWTLHEVGSVSSSFGVVVGSDGDRAVSVAVLEADDPDTTQGARLRVWSSDDLSSWDQLAGSDNEVFTDAFAHRIGHFGDDLVIVGAVNRWPNGPAGPAVRVPAVWVSHDRGPFARMLLPEGSGTPAVGDAHDITVTDDGFVVVGGSGGFARAWFSADLVRWDAAIVTDPEPLGPSGAGAMWSVAADGSNLVAAAVGDPAGGTPTWSSRDGGRTWQPAGDGPSVVLGHVDAVVGVRIGEPVGPWWLHTR